MKHKPHGPYEKFIKRPLDCVLAFLAIVILSPVYIIISLLVLIFLGHPILFKQPRPGKDEKVFNMYKFRTMTNEKDSNGRYLSDEQRLTGFGRFLRKTSLDELPEIFCILNGSMSLIGPRPLLVDYLPYYTDEEHHRHDVRPGLTGLAQVNGRNSLRWDERFLIDLEYVDNISFALDVKIFFKTIKKVLFKADVQMGNELKFSRLDVERADNNNTVINAVDEAFFKEHSSELFDCIKTLKKQNQKESVELFNNMEKFINDGSAIVYASTIYNRVNGFIWGYVIRDGVIHINYFVVLPEYRKLGIGSKLLEEMISKNRDYSFELLVYKDNEHAIELYEKNGFVKTTDSAEKYKMVLEK